MPKEKNNNTLSQAVGKGLEIELRGKKYIVEPLTVGDVADLESHIRSMRLQDFITAAKNTDMDSSEKLTIITTLASEPVSMAQGNEIDNVRFLFWSALRKKQPEITMEEINELISMDNIDEMNAILEGLSGGETDEEVNPPTL